ncbi:ABC transporter ATP-binding protein [Lysinibacillus fusiformis]|uniref:ABC transporter ATP-binding protein n=1 Tax=Lysinibacillus fusiformis TaxID=28031 RepID=UPI00088DCAE8|nr:ABC transporter ATP-binding protein [Lysinibacillus fusiformis]SCX66078.1 ABC-2 type transport system ATP-binding protein [Lysinibacillus fusiformis]SDB51544.1 ABC-2 type transport system ATP-binding protein [Lysinibacillus fusiformis]SFI93915.1 ABC-2 type transport system ATP-binding protein [Lysinibacillus fusiformis]SFT22496.1 ABC-2 type transport system ATP-binding protein [Lysinibacillus fusiformis]
MTTLLQVTGLTKRFAEHNVVDNVQFILEEKTSTALIGPNGAGKTTTLSMLTGLLTPTAGSVEMLKGDLRENIGFLPQYPQFHPWLSALEFTEMAARLNGVSAKNAKLEAQKTLEFVGLGNVQHKKIATFSGGMRQRLGISQAIVHKPKLLLLDEPVSALDPVGRREVLDLLKGLQQETTILYSTHILNDAEEMTDQLLFLQNGKLVEQGTLREVRQRFDEQNYIVEFSSEEEANLFASSTDHVVGCYVYIEILNEEPTMKELLHRLSNCPYTIRKVERQTASLEEIFMKVAKKA